MATGKIMLLKSGLAVIWPSKIYDIHGDTSFKEDPVLSVVNGGVDIGVGQMKIHCNLDAVDHLIEYGPDLFFMKIAAITFSITMVFLIWSEIIYCRSKEPSSIL